MYSPEDVHIEISITFEAWVSRLPVPVAGSEDQSHRRRYLRQGDYAVSRVEFELFFVHDVALTRHHCKLSRSIWFIPHIILSITYYHTHLKWVGEEIILKERHLPVSKTLSLWWGEDEECNCHVLLFGLDWRECERNSARKDMYSIYIYKKQFGR